MASWVSPFPSFQDFPVDMILSNWKEVAFSFLVVFRDIHSSSAPPPDGLKLNFDGSAHGKPGLAGLG